MPTIVECEQRSDEWARLHIGTVTASKAHRLLTPAKRKTLIQELVAERLAREPELPDELFSKPVQWGIRQEKFAVARYAFERDVDVDHCGFMWGDGLEGWAGYSPDGLVNQDGLIETKCPSSRVHVSYFQDGPPKEYQAQMQFGLLISQRQWCDFISFDPRLKTDLLILRQHPDTTMLKALQDGLDEVIAGVKTTIDNIRSTF